MTRHPDLTCRAESTESESTLNWEATEASEFSMTTNSRRADTIEQQEGWFNRSREDRDAKCFSFALALVELA